MQVAHYLGPLGDLYAEVHKSGASSPPDTQAHPQHEPELTQRENAYSPEPAPRDRSGLALALRGGRSGGLPQRQTPERIYEEVQNLDSPSPKNSPGPVPDGEYFEHESSQYAEISQFSVNTSSAPAQEAQSQGHKSPPRLVRKNAVRGDPRARAGKAAPAPVPVPAEAAVTAAAAATAVAAATTKPPPPVGASKPTPPPRSRSQAPTHMAPNPQQNARTDALTNELKAVLSKRAACPTGAVTARVTRGNEVIA